MLCCPSARLCPCCQLNRRVVLLTGFVIDASESLVWNAQAHWLLLGLENSKRTLELSAELPSAAEWLSVCKSLPSHDEGARAGLTSLLFPGLLHEKLGLDDRALEYLEVATWTGDDMTKGGSNQFHFQIISHW